MTRALALAVSAFVVACGSDPAPRGDEPALYKMPWAVTAMEDARLGISHFWAAVESGDSRYSGPVVIVAMPTEAYERDYVWVVEPVRLGDGTVSGLIYPEEDAPLLNGLRPGEPVTVLETDIVDWMLRDGEKTRGSFVNRASLIDGPGRGSDVEALLARFHEDPLPPIGLTD